MKIYAVICEGQVEVRNPQHKRLETLECGQTIGDGFFLNEPMRAEIVAIADTRCICLRFAEFFEFLDV